MAPRSGHIKQLQWGLHFADLCYTHKVKLVNYPIGLLPLGVPNGLQGVAKMNIAKYVKPIVKDFVQYWQQEAEAKKAELAGDHQYARPLYSDDDDYDARKNRVFQQDLVRFVPWNEGISLVLSAIFFCSLKSRIDELEMDIAEQAHIGIVLQEPQGNGKPLVLAKVLHSKKFLAKATAHKVEIEHGQDGQDSSDDKGDGSEDESEHDRAQRALPARSRTKRSAGDVEDRDLDRRLKKSKKGKPAHLTRSESDVSTPKQFRKRKPVSDEEPEADVRPSPSPSAPPLPKAKTGPPPPAPTRKPRPQAPGGMEVPRPKTKDSSVGSRQVKKPTVRHSDVDATKSRTQDNRAIAPRPRARAHPTEEKTSQSKLVVLSTSEEEEDKRPKKRPRVAQVQGEERMIWGEGSRAGGTKRKRAGN